MYNKVKFYSVDFLLELTAIFSHKKVAAFLGLSQSAISKVVRNNSNIQSKARLNMSHLPIDVDYFKIIDTKEKAYWLGCLCADGNIKKGKVTLASATFRDWWEGNIGLNTGAKQDCFCTCRDEITKLLNNENLIK